MLSCRRLSYEMLLVYEKFGRAVDTKKSNSETISGGVKKRVARCPRDKVKEDLGGGVRDTRS